MKFIAAAVLVLGLLTGVQVTSALRLQQVSVPPIITSGGGLGVCPSQQERDNVRQTQRNTVAGILNLTLTIRCGPGQWTRVAYLNMLDPLQTCPSAWRLNTSSGVRVCGRPSSSNNMCHGTFYSTGRAYTKVCGRVIGYQIGHTDAFHSSRNINVPYVEGVSITHGSPRSHIWTLAAGRSETGSNADCPCATGSSNVPPSFVGNNYYCESGNTNSSTVDYYLYANDPLWDGQQCSTEGTCCSGGQSPPWFVVDFPSPSTDTIEVRICSDYNTEEDTPIQLLELYIQ